MAYRTIAVDLVTPVGHQNFNSYAIEFFDVDLIVCKRHFSPAKEVQVKNFIGVKTGFGFLVRLERLFWFPLVWLWNLPRFLRAERIVYLSFDFYCEPFLIFITRLFCSEVIVIHHSKPKFSRDIVDRYKCALMKVCFANCVNYGFLDTFAKYLQTACDLPCSVLHHPVNVVPFDGNVEDRPIEFAMLSRSDAAYWDDFGGYAEAKGFSFCTREGLATDLDITKLLLGSRKFVFWSLFEHKVSGMVFDAVGCGCRIVIRPSGFADYLVARFPGQIEIVQDFDELSR